MKIEEQYNIDVADPDRRNAFNKLRDILRKAFKPKLRADICEYAEKHVVLTRNMSKHAGRFKLDRTPYMRGPLDAFMRYRHVLCVWAAQLGKTLMEQIIMTFVVDSDPGPMFFTFPNKPFSRRKSTKHLQPFITNIECVSKHLQPGKNSVQTFAFKFDNMTIDIAWAGSPTMLAGEPIRYLIRDEIAKYKQNDKTEGHPLDLSARRTSSFDELGRIFDVTTPSLKKDYVDNMLNKESTYHEYWVPCPKCGNHRDVKDLGEIVYDPCDHVKVTQDPSEAHHIVKQRLIDAGYQVLKWANIEFYGANDPDVAAKRAHYRCEYCSCVIHHKEVHGMTLKGIWFPRFPDRSIVGFHLPSWYRSTSYNSFGNVVRRFVTGLQDPAKLQEWANEDCAEGWEEYGKEVKADHITDHKRGYEPDTIPFEPLVVLLTTDIRESEIHYVVGAWGEGETYAQIRYGMLARPEKVNAFDGSATGQSLSPLDDIRRLTFKSISGKTYGITLTCVDSGWDTDEVYAYAQNRERVACTKGNENMNQVMEFSFPLKKHNEMMGANSKGPVLISFNTNYYKDVWATKCKVTKDNPGEWMLHNAIFNDYISHMTAEKKVERRKRMVWVKFGKHNHWFDCEIMQIVGARFLNVKDMKLPKPQPKKTATIQEAHRELMGRDVSGVSNRLYR